MVVVSLMHRTQVQIAQLIKIQMEVLVKHNHKLTEEHRLSILNYGEDHQDYLVVKHT